MKLPSWPAWPLRRQLFSLLKCIFRPVFHCFLSRARSRGPHGGELPAGRRPRRLLSLRQTKGFSRPAGGVVAAQLVPDRLDEDTAFAEFDVNRDTDLILGYVGFAPTTSSPPSTRTRSASAPRAAASLDGPSVSTSCSTRSRQWCYARASHWL